MRMNNERRIARLSESEAIALENVIAYQERAYAEHAVNRASDTFRVLLGWRDYYNGQAVAFREALSLFGARGES